jgi:hypothetical protein
MLESVNKRYINKINNKWNPQNRIMMFPSK